MIVDASLPDIEMRPAILMSTRGIDLSVCLSECWAKKNTARPRGVSFLSRSIMGIAVSTVVLLATLASSTVTTTFVTFDLPPGTVGTSDARGSPALPTSDVPVSTHNWWDSLVWKYQYNGDVPNPLSLWMHATPLSYRATADGLWVSAMTGTGVLQPQQPTELGLETATLDYTPTKPDIVISHSEPNKFESARLQHHGDWHARGVLLPANLTFTMVAGLPCAYIRGLTGGSIQVVFDTVPSNVEGTPDGTRVTVGQGSSWYLGGGAWEQVDARTWKSLSGGEEVAIAYSANGVDTAVAEICKDLVGMIDTKMAFAYHPENATVRVTLDWGTKAPTPIALLPHHRTDSGQTTSAGYVNPKGTMELRVLESGVLVYDVPFHGVAWELATGDGAECDQVVEWHALGREVWWTGRRYLDGYWGGLTIAKIANVALVAHACNLWDIRDEFIEEVRGALEDWFTPDVQPLLRYDKDWKTVNGYPDGGFYSDKLINDHHFQFGYIIVAAATVTRFQREWADKWGPAIDLLIRDVASTDRDDDSFPFMRNFDPWAGHSWATPAVFEYGLNQESSSEAINFAYSLILWGEVTGDPKTRDLGVMLYASETQAVNMYWFHPDAGLKRPYAGMVWTSAVSYALWWLGPPQGVLGINVQPVTGGSLYFDPAVLDAARQWTEKQPGSDAKFWPEVWALIESIGGSPSPSVPDKCEQQTLTCAYTSAFTGALRSWGLVNSSVTTDHTIARVFSQPGGDGTSRNTYYAYNPDPSIPIIVKFSDGFRMFAGADRVTIVTGECNDCVNPI